MTPQLLVLHTKPAADVAAYWPHERAAVHVARPVPPLLFKLLDLFKLPLLYKRLRKRLRKLQCFTFPGRARPVPPSVRQNDRDCDDRCTADGRHARHTPVIVLTLR